MLGINLKCNNITLKQPLHIYGNLKFERQKDVIFMLYLIFEMLFLPLLEIQYSNLKINDLSKTIQAVLKI